jgi:hypothetical protein
VKRYLLFCVECYYPSGGWQDFVGLFDSLEEAKEHLSWDQRIVDSQTGEIIWLP